MILSEHQIVRKEKANGGKGHIIIEHLLSQDQLQNQCGMFAHVTLEVNCSLGYHEHHGNGEAYYITKGTGLYSDNGTMVEVKAGDVIEVAFGSRAVRVRVLDVRESTKKADAAAMYEVISET